MDIKAALTVAITVLAFLVCFIPPIVFAARSHAGDAGWPGSLSQFSVFISSGINPIIYCFRTRRFRWALKQLLNDPCGRSFFQELKQEQRAPRDLPRRITNAANNKVADEPLTASVSTCLTVDQRANYPTAGQEKCSVQAQNCEDGRGHEKEDQLSLVGTVVKMAWVESQQMLPGSPAKSGEKLSADASNIVG